MKIVEDDVYILDKKNKSRICTEFPLLVLVKECNGDSCIVFDTNGTKISVQSKLLSPLHDKGLKVRISKRSKNHAVNVKTLLFLNALQNKSLGLLTEKDTNTLKAFIKKYTFYHKQYKNSMG